MPLSVNDIEQLEICQTNCLKAALRLPRSAHHTALLRALGIPRLHECLRRAAFCSFRSAFRSDHRLRQVFVSALALLAVCPSELFGSFIYHVFCLCNYHFDAMMEVVTGFIDRSRVYSPLPEDGLVDSISLVLNDQSQMARRLLRLLTS